MSDVNNIQESNNVKPLEYFMFRNYSIAVKKWLQQNTYLSTYPEDDNITVAYMTPERAFAKYIYPTINGATTSPNINFYLSSNEYAEGENSLGFVREYRLFDENRKAKVVKPPLVYRLTYSCTIYTRNMPEMDVILYQILTKAHKNAKATFEVDGQWAEIMAGDPTNETELEPGERQNIVNRWSLDLTIPRAYVPLDYIETGTMYNGFDFDTTVDEELEET